MDGTIRADIKVGSKVLIVKKEDQRTGKLTSGIVMRLLTNSAVHPRGIKVMLEGGVVGRVQEIL
ncbi:MAG: YwbE family protein [Clostridium sp.]